MGKGNGSTRTGNSGSPRGLNTASSATSATRGQQTDMFGSPTLPSNGRFTQREIAPLVRLTEDAEQATEYGGRTDSIYASYGGYQMQGSRNPDGTITPVSAYTTENGNHFDSDLHGRLTEAGFRDYAALYFAEWAREDARGSRRRR